MGHHAQGRQLLSIRPSYSSTLVLAAAKGGDQNGNDAVTLETDKDQPWQQWSLKKHANGNYSLIPRHAPDMGLDDFGGKQAPGSKIDLWTYKRRRSAPAMDHQAAGRSPIRRPTAPATRSRPATSRRRSSRKMCSRARSSSSVHEQRRSSPARVRDVTVFIPAQYDGSKPACVYVKTDGYNPKEKSCWRR